MTTSTFITPTRVSPAYRSILPGHDRDSCVEDSSVGSETTEDDVGSVVGVSISRVQTRLKSPTTPAADKAAALNTLWADGLFDPHPPPETGLHSGTEACVAIPAEHDSEPTSSDFDSTATPVPLPTPWTSGPRLFETNPAESEQHEEQISRPPSGSAAMGNFVDINVKRFMSSFTMPSLPSPNIGDFSLPTISSFIGARPNAHSSPYRKRHKRSQSDGSQHSQRSIKTVDWPVAKLMPGNDATLPPLKANIKAPCQAGSSKLDGSSLRAIHDEPRTSEASLRRTISDQSLALRRATSTASSLGDDSRWEHVQKQVNSRAKAISDTVQDSKIKLPALPSLPSVKLGSLRPDFFRFRASSDTVRPSWLLEPGSGTSKSDSIRSPERTLDQEKHTSYPRATAMKHAEVPKPTQNSTHPHLDQALESLRGDIVIMGGYRGSVLRSAIPPHRQLWVPFKVGLNIRKVDLEVGLEPQDEERMEESIIPSGMLSHIGPVDMGRRLLKRLRSCRNVREGRLRVHDYGYDWRLSPHLLSRKLIQYLEKLPSNANRVHHQERGCIVIAHSLGGLITRHAVNKHPELFAGVIYAGVPQHCINILGPLRNGDDVLLSSKVLTAQVNFTLRTSFLLLPEDGRCFVDKQTKEDYLVNFSDPAEWNRYALSPCIAATSSPYTTPERKGLINFMADNLPSLPSFEQMPLVDARSNAKNLERSSPADVAPYLDRQSSPSSCRATIQSTIPIHKAEEYLARTLADTVRFREELKFVPQRAARNEYPPLAILYGSSVPTVWRARVASRDAIKCSDAYDQLAFASGDGVCLAKAALLPKGYEYAPGGKVKTDRGHVGLLGDLDAVGKCLSSVMQSRKTGVGLGPLLKDDGRSAQP